MSITLFSIDKRIDSLFNINTDVCQIIESGSELHNYLYDNNCCRYRTINEDHNIYKKLDLPLFAISCFDKHGGYTDYDSPNNYGKSEYISLLIKTILQLNDDFFDGAINIILHRHDINCSLYRVKTELAWYDQFCDWIEPNDVAENFIMDDVVKELTTKKIIVNLALYSHGDPDSIINQLLRKEEIQMSQIDNLFDFETIKNRIVDNNKT